MFLNHFNVVISKINFKKTLHNIKQTFRVKKKKLKNKQEVTIPSRLYKKKSIKSFNFAITRLRVKKLKYTFNGLIRNI
jgi:DUF4097 and DUF4098 domain-containing protein YvlB